jgi:hypothetical protein
MVVDMRTQELCDDGVMATQTAFQSSDSGSIPTSSLQNYQVRPIEYAAAIEKIVNFHYLKRKCPISFAFGLFNGIETNPVGVITYGVPPSSTLLKGICGPDEAHNVFELNRLWISDLVPRNGESFLIGHSIKKVNREIIVSYADTSQGHIGYVYQASNFYYTGLSAKFTDPKVKGLENQHHATFANGLTNRQVIEKYGDAVSWIQRPRKHRYIYFNASTKRRKELLAKLRYKVIAYPKAVKTGER